MDKQASKKRKTDKTGSMTETSKPPLIKYELIGNCFSKDSFILVTRTSNDGIQSKETFHANKLPCFLGGLLKNDPDAYAYFLNKAIVVLNTNEISK